MPVEQLLVLERMQQQSGLLGAEDDWTGVTSSAERRRVQNRINQRAYRESPSPMVYGYGGLADSVPL